MTPNYCCAKNEKYSFNYYKAKEKYVNLFEKEGIYGDIHVKYIQSYC